MSFVYAERCEDLIYIIADTFWERPGIGIYDQWKLNPMVKIVSLPQGKVAAFAGNSNAAEAAFKSLFENAINDTAQFLLEINRASISGGQSVDFILADQNDFSLMEIADGEIKARQNVCLGSPSAFNLFQRIRLKDNELTESAETTFSIQKRPDHVQPNSADRYLSALRAFEQAIRELGDTTCGGFPIPIFITKWQVSFGAYLHTVRAPLSLSELVPGEWAPVPLQDEISGGYEIIFAGDDQAFSLHFPYGTVGFTYTGFKKDGLFAPKLKAKDPYEFAHIAETTGCPPSISSWRSPANDRWKITQLVKAKKWSRAEVLIKDSCIQVINHLAGLNPNVAFDRSRNLFYNLNLMDECRSEKEYFEQINFLLDAERVMRANMAGEAEENHNWWVSKIITP